MGKSAGRRVVLVVRALIVSAMTLSAVLVAGSRAAEAAGNSGVVAAKVSDPAAAYCIKKGGVVSERLPYYGTNSAPTQWLRLSGNAAFCKFTAKHGFASRIYVLLSTLYATQPTLAALAYYAQAPEDEQCQKSAGSPGSCYCTQLGGTDLFGGINLAGGGWVQMSDPVDMVLDTCIFPDLSSIDSFGLFYHSANIIRGANLDGILRYPNPNKK